MRLSRLSHSKKGEVIPNGKVYDTPRCDTGFNSSDDEFSGLRRGYRLNQFFVESEPMHVYIAVMEHPKVTPKAESV